mgnify:CR=1 FL=1
MTERMDKRFAALAAEGRPALVTYFMGGDPDYAASLEIMKALPSAANFVAIDCGRDGDYARAVMAALIVRSGIGI